MISFSQTVYIALIYASNELPYGSLIVKIIKLNLWIRVSHISILLVGGALLPPVRVGTWCRRQGEQLATSGVSRLYQPMSIYHYLQ